ncbi:MAG: T9SS type A sorting domain-containing protein [bacterium]
MTVYHRLINLSNGAARSAILAILCFALLTISASVTLGSGIPASHFPDGTNPQTKSDGNDITAGTTQLFWAYAQGFFSGYYQISGTCQLVGDQAYLFTEDAYVNDLTSTQTGSVVFTAASGSIFKSTDGGQTWQIVIAGIPTATGGFTSFNADNYNRRAEIFCLYSRGEYSAIIDTIWAGTGFGVFMSTAAGDTFRLQSNNMDTDEDGNKPEIYDVLGHPTDTQSLWAATEDGVQMTRNANRWKRLTAGLPPGEGTTWASNPCYALAYHNDVLFTSSSKGLFFGSIRPLGTSANSEILTSWKPAGGQVLIAEDTTFATNTDTLRLIVASTSSQGFVIEVGQSITVVDTVQDVYWAGLVNIAPSGLVIDLTDNGIFYYPTGTTPPAQNYSTLDLDHLIAYAYSQIAGPALFVESFGDTTVAYLGGATNGLYSYQFFGDLSGYLASQETITSSHFTHKIYQIAKEEDNYYFATDQGLYRATEPHGIWTQLTGCVYNNTMDDSLAIETRTVAFGPGNLIYTGGHLGGMLRAEDGMNFEFANLGLVHRNGTLGQLSSFLTEFEDSTPADPSTGILDLMQEWWGDLPPATSTGDIDSDPKVTVLFTDIDDQYYLDTGDGTYVSGFYDGNNEYSRLYRENSNQQEMIYLDTDPQWIDGAGVAACNQVFNLINWNQDFNEEKWLREGMVSFSQHVAGYPLATGDVNFPALNGLTAWGDYNPNVEHLYSFLLVLYLYEQYFPDELVGSDTVHTIAEVATSTYHGIEGLGRLINEKQGGTSSPNADYTSVFASVFEDFVIASSLDIPDANFNDGKYGFSALNVKMPATSYNWYWPLANPTSKPPFSWHLPFWGTRTAQIVDTLFFNSAHPIVDVKVNGDDNNQFAFYFLFSFTGRFDPGMSGDDVIIIKVPLDSLTQKGSLDFSDPVLLDSLNVANLVLDGPLGTYAQPKIVRLVAISTSEFGSSPTCYTFGDDMTPPPYLYLTIAQNPIDDRYLDVYSFTNERVFPDGGQLFRINEFDLTELEGPQVDITGGKSSYTGQDTLFTLDQDVFYFNETASDFVYHKAYHLDYLQFPAQLIFTAYGEDICGNVKSSASDSVTVDFIQKESGGTISTANQQVVLTIPPQALPRDALIILSTQDLPNDVSQDYTSRVLTSVSDASHYPVGPIVSAGTVSLDLLQPVELEIPYDPLLAGGSEVGVYRADDDGWTYIGGTPTSGTQTSSLKTYSWEFGQFQVFAGPLTDMTPELPYSFSLNQNYPNPFNPATNVTFELPSAQQIRLQVFDLMGRLVANLAEGHFNAGKHQVHWLPQQIASGIYFLRLEAQEGVLIRKISLLK